MSGCNDKIINYLNQFGFNVLELPRKRIGPLDLIVRNNGKPEWIGKSQDVFTCSASLPEFYQPESGLTLMGEESGNIKFKIGFKFLANVISCFGGTVPSISFGYQRAKNVKFIFTNVEESGVSFVNLLNYLDSCKLPPTSSIKKFFNRNDHEVFLLSDVLRSKSICVVAQDDRDNTIEIDVPSLAKVIGANMEISWKDKIKYMVKYEGGSERTFGFKCHRLWYEDDQFNLKLASGIKMLAADYVEETEPLLEVSEPILLGTDELIDLKMPD